MCPKDVDGMTKSVDADQTEQALFVSRLFVSKL